MGNCAHCQHTATVIASPQQFGSTNWKMLYLQSWKKNNIKIQPRLNVSKACAMLRILAGSFSSSFTQFNSTCSCVCKSMGLVIMSVYHMVQGLQEVDRSGPPWSLATYIPVGERCDHQSRGVPEVLIGVQELCITDVSKAVLLHLIPPVMMKDGRYHTMTAWKDTSCMPLRLD